MDDGWTRWVFDKYRVPFTQITEKDIAAGSLNDEFDAIVFPDHRRHSRSRRRAIGEAGAAPTALARRCVRGRRRDVLAFNARRLRDIDLKLPVKNVLEGVKNTDFYAPGSIFSVEVNRDSPLAAALTTPVPAVWFEDSPAFEITDPAAATAVRYPATGNALLSGWLLGRRS